MQKVNLQDRLGVVLGRFGRAPGCHFCLCFYLLLYYLVQINVFEQGRCPRAIWVSKRTIWEAKMESKSIKNQFKMKVNNALKFASISERFWIDFEIFNIALNPTGGGAGGRGAAPPRYLTFGKYHRFEEFEELE